MGSAQADDDRIEDRRALSLKGEPDRFRNGGATIQHLTAGGMVFEEIEDRNFREKSGRQKSAQKFSTDAAGEQAYKLIVGGQDHAGPFRMAVEQPGYLAYGETGVDAVVDEG